ncbi:MAG TPA: type III PLP-dependent enzyme, partial [Candidatus Cloacimonas sp.]|nr:type III PLP-dependent enzyme [Candidatus Cloacimonas sp.]
MFKEPYIFNVARFMDEKRFEKIREFAKDVTTPCLIVDLDIVRNKYLELQASMPNYKIYYAVKANPMQEVIMLLNELGANFDLASPYELDQLLNLGIEPARLSFGNTIKKVSDIKYFYDRGVRFFTTDSKLDLHNLAKYAPGAKVLFRILTEGTGADWPLSRKFGSHPDTIYHLIVKAAKMNLQPWGIS